MYIGVKIVTVNVFSLLFCGYFIVWTLVFNIWQVWYDTIKCLRCLEPKVDPGEWLKNAEMSLSWKSNSLCYIKWAILFWNLSVAESIFIVRVWQLGILHRRVRRLAVNSVCEVQSVFYQGTEPASCYTYVVTKMENTLLKPWYYGLI